MSACAHVRSVIGGHLACERNPRQAPGILAPVLDGRRLVWPGGACSRQPRDAARAGFAVTLGRFWVWAL